MSGFVELRLKRNRGWPWPENSWGLAPMFGVDGWCHSCGVPKHPQSGSIILQRKSMKVHGAWIPNWQFDVICVNRQLAQEAASRFDLELREVLWHASSPGDAMQIVVPSVGTQWFDHEKLVDAAVVLHGSPGARCADCGVWRWMPLDFDELPPVTVELDSMGIDIGASPEWFGAGWKAFRQILMRRELAEMLADASPRDFKVVEVF